MFSEFNIKSEVAENGLQAVEKIKNADFDLVLMDIEMPEMSGYEAAQHIRKELKSNVPIIAMSAHAMSEEKERSKQQGMNDYISKPLKAELLFEKMLQAITTNSALKNTPAPLVNLDPLRASIHGRDDLLLEMLDLFLTGIPDDLDTIYHAIGQQAFDTIRRRSHRMKSTILAVGIAPLTAILAEMEALAETSSSIERIEELYTELLPLCRQALSEVEQEKRKMTKNGK
jgi:CheY-like chemotaxis protein